MYVVNIVWTYRPKLVVFSIQRAVSYIIGASHLPLDAHTELYARPLCPGRSAPIRQCPCRVMLSQVEGTPHGLYSSIWSFGIPN